jgi:hypothetical protein
LRLAPRPSGSPLITRLSLPTCRAQYPDGLHECAYRWLPHGCGLPYHRGGSASALKLSRPAQPPDQVRGSLVLQPVGLLSRPWRPPDLIRGLQPGQLPAQTARQLPDPSTLTRVEPSSTRETRLQGAHGDSALNSPRPSPPKRLSRGPSFSHKKNAAHGRMWRPRSNNCGKAPHPRPFSPWEKGGASVCFGSKPEINSD